MSIFDMSKSYKYINAEVMTRAASLYGDALPDVISERLKTELAYVKEQDLSSVYTISHLVIKYAHDNGQPTCSRGAIGSSLIAFLLGITDINPLLPHYYCENCKHTEFILDNSVYSGYDLSLRECPVCGRRLSSDGHNIPFESFIGRKEEILSDINLNLPFSFRNDVLHYLNDILGKECIWIFNTNSSGVIEQEINTDSNKSIEDVINNGFYFVIHAPHDSRYNAEILGFAPLEILKRLEDYTGIHQKEVDIKDPKILDLFKNAHVIGIDSDEPATLGIPEFGKNFVRNIIKQARPTNFGELVRLTGLFHGTNVNFENPKKLLADNIPEWNDESSFNIRDILPKAHSVEYVKMALILAWYKIYYPVEFYVATFNVQYPDIKIEGLCKGMTSSQILSNIKGLGDLDKELFEECMKRGIEFELNENSSDCSELFTVGDDKIFMNCGYRLSR